MVKILFVSHTHTHTLIEKIRDVEDPYSISFSLFCWLFSTCKHLHFFQHSTFWHHFYNTTGPYVFLDHNCSKNFLTLGYLGMEKLEMVFFLFLLIIKTNYMFSFMFFFFSLCIRCVESIG